MAIFDWSLQTIKRSAKRAPSRSAVAAAAYRSGTYLRDHRTGAEHDFTRRRGIFSEIVLPPGIKPPILERPDSRSELRSRLWNAAEAAETRCNSVVAREITLALPHELPQDACRRLTRAFAKYVARNFGVAADVAVHPPNRNGDRRNIHAHILFTTRRVSDGFAFGEKTRELDAAATGGPIIKALREKWADFANLVLLDAGLNIAIDHRSLADRGIDRAPGHHIGPEATNRARGLRSMIARLEAEAEEIEREVLPLMWPRVHVEVAAEDPQKVEQAWTEWATLHERMRQAALDEIDEEAEGERRPAMQAKPVADGSRVGLRIRIVEEGDIELPPPPVRAEIRRPAKPKESRVPSPLAPKLETLAIDERPKPKTQPRQMPRIQKTRRKDGWER